jgi:hypothetical protein
MPRAVRARARSAPGFESTPATLDLLQSRGIVVFGADLWASDWNPMTPRQELKLITGRLKIARKGSILFHDPNPVSRSQGANGRHVAGFFALSQGQPLSRGASGAGRAPVAARKACLEPESGCGSRTIKAAFMAPHVTV